MQSLLELGFVEGAEIDVLHEGPIGRDPIAVRINGTSVCRITSGKTRAMSA